MRLSAIAVFGVVSGAISLSVLVIACDASYIWTYHVLRIAVVVHVPGVFAVAVISIVAVVGRLRQLPSPLKYGELTQEI